MQLDLMVPSVEIGISTTNLDAMVEFYAGFLELPHTGDMDFPGGTQKRYSLGKNVLKLVTYDTPPIEASLPGGGPAQTGIRYVTVVVSGLRAVQEAFDASPYQVTVPVTELAEMPGFGWMYVADPDGNWIEISGSL